jgi:hypothetical protein
MFEIEILIRDVILWRFFISIYFNFNFNFNLKLKLNSFEIRPKVEGLGFRVMD